MPAVIYMMPDFYTSWFNFFVLFFFFILNSLNKSLALIA
jgi:hypothetical protein